MAVEILSQYGEKLDCHSCDEKLRKERGHDEIGIVPFWIGKEVIFRCPLVIITQLSYEYINAFEFYEKGCFPNGGCWRDESDKFLQAMRVLKNAYSQAEKERVERGRSKSTNSPKAAR